MKRGQSRPLALCLLSFVVLGLYGPDAFLCGRRERRQFGWQTDRQLQQSRAATSWQQRLDKAFLSVDAKPAARLRNVQKVLADPAAVMEDVSRAFSVLFEKGFREGHPEAIDALWPKGTRARSDIEGLQALRKQLPEIVSDLSNSQLTSQSQGSPTSSSQFQLQNVASGLVELALDAKKRKEFEEEAKNIFRPKPRGLETPSYAVLRNLAPDVQLRRYEPFTVARRSMSATSGSGFASTEGFTSLASYLFGNNSDSAPMEMTSPVEISYTGSDKARMSFVLPKAYADSPPSPEETSIELVEVPERLVVAVAFPGVVTQGEIERQRQKLDELFKTEQTLRQINANEYSVLQYNPPYTLPWRRCNELAVVVAEVAEKLQVQPPEVKVLATDELSKPSQASEESESSGS
eukprot:TRINITY_DN78310_c0_g1_i1.p1 TRINITY_DN78310_c0_g1~~TRINITY_DN78310_c0_g1_i1.p1  ORF type:complete len:406 (-),score=70.16 TRINITY_DN78310_c0_g1_i1:260-1477(-)